MTKLPSLTNQHDQDRKSKRMSKNIIHHLKIWWEACIDQGEYGLRPQMSRWNTN